VRDAVVYKIRLIFEKGEEVKYISHLDLMRTFARGMKRSGLPIKYSEGFNPHPIMSIAFPLSVGTGGKEEYIDLELVKEVDIHDIILSLNNNMPKGIKIIDGEYVNDNKFLDSINKGEYFLEIVCRKLPDTIDDEIKKILNKDIIEIDKMGKHKGKKIKKNVNIRPDILDFKIEKIKNNTIYCNGVFCVSKAKTLNPSLFIKALEKHINNLEVDYVKCRRNKLIH
jgi:radical SAM-linked protein